jgi:hypothetical protein
LRRGELSLHLLCFADHKDSLANANGKPSQRSTQDLKSGSVLDQQLENKVKIALSYQEFLYKCLGLSITHLSKKAITDFERTFIEYLLAICYIRVPEFREELNKCLDVNNEYLSELKGTEYDLNQNQVLKSNYKNVALYEQFDWQNEFYMIIKDEQKYKENMEFLQKTLEGKSWHHRFHKRGIGFFFFVNELCLYIHETLIVKETIPWQDIPGYRLLLKAFLIEMKKRDLQKYPEALVDGSCSLLFNDKLLNIFCTLIYKKTNLYDGELVFKSFEYIDKWFESLRKRKKLIPSNFDHYSLMRGIFMV